MNLELGIKHISIEHDYDEENDEIVGEILLESKQSLKNEIIGYLIKAKEGDLYWDEPLDIDIDYGLNFKIFSDNIEIGHARFWLIPSELSPNDLFIYLDRWSEGEDIFIELTENKSLKNKYFYIENDFLLLESLHIHQDYRNRGIGKWALSKILKLLKESVLEISNNQYKATIILRTFTDSKPLHNFYSSCGLIQGQYSKDVFYI